MGKLLAVALTAAIMVGRLLIVPRLGVPTLEGPYEAASHLVVGALLILPLYDWRQRLGPSRLYGALGAVASVWELVMFLIQKGVI